MISTRTIARTLAALALLLGMAAPAARAEGGFVVIRNAKNSSATINTAVLRDLLIGRAKKWPSGATVQLVLGKEDSAGLGWVASTYFSTSATFLSAKIRQEVFKGELRNPLIPTGDADTIAKVKANEGALGVVSEGTALQAGVALVTVGD